jgi:flagellar motor switch protein FliG
MGHIEQMGPVSPDLVEQVAAEFTQQINQVQHLKLKALPAAKSPIIEDKEEKSGMERSQGLKSLLSLDVDHLSTLIRDEHPQTIAVILVHLKPDMASEVLSKLPDEKKTDVALRIANSEKIVAGMIDEIEKAFEDILSNKAGSITTKVGGVGQLAEILNQVEASTAQLILDEIEEEHPELSAEIKQMMFVFEDLVMVDDRGMQALLRKVETKELSIALKAASEEVKEKVFRNMSTRAADMVAEEMENVGSVRMRDVEAAQNTITRLIQDMEEKGELVISGRRGEEFIG